MKFYTGGNTIRVLFLVAVVLLLALTYAPTERAGAQRGPCSCDNLAACGGGGAEDNAGATLAVGGRPPRAAKNVKLTEYGAGRNGIRIQPPIMDDELPGLDEYTGTAEDTAENNEVGRTNMTGHFGERRRYLFNQLKRARRAQASGEISQEIFTQMLTLLRGALEALNNEEFEAARLAVAGNRELRAAQIRELEGRVNAENERRTNEILAVIERMDLNSYDEHLDSIRQAIFDNLAQYRALELFDSDGSNALARARRIAGKLLEKMLRECQGKNLSAEDVSEVGRIVIFLGNDAEPPARWRESVERMLNKCTPRTLVPRPTLGSRTLVARATFNGIEYEARHCIGGQANRASLAGDWQITIAGQMQGSGSAQLGAGGVGTWNGTAKVGGEITITMQGPAEVVSGGGGCALRIAAATATGQVMGQTVTMPGVSGDLPIQILNQACNIR